MNNITYLRHSTIDQGLQYLSLQIQGTIEIVILNIIFKRISMHIDICLNRNLTDITIAEANPKLCIRLLSQEELMRLSVLINC